MTANDDGRIITGSFVRARSTRSPHVRFGCARDFAAAKAARRGFLRTLAITASVMAFATTPAGAQTPAKKFEPFQAIIQYHAYTQARETIEQETQARQKQALQFSADPAFRRFVDPVALGEAWTEIESARFTDDALQLLKAERTLRRPHPATPAAPILAAAVRLAAACGDHESLNRLVTALENDRSLAQLEAQAKSVRAHVASGAKTPATTQHPGNSADAYEHAFQQNLQAACARGETEAIRSLAELVNQLDDIHQDRRVALHNAAQHAIQLQRILPPLTASTRELLDDLGAIPPVPRNPHGEVRPIEREHAETGHATSGNTTSGHATSGDPRPGDAAPGHATSGSTTSGHATSGPTTSGHATSGPTTSGHAESGHHSRGLSGLDPFTRKYHAIRQRFIDDYLYKGSVAFSYTDKIDPTSKKRHETFGDQTFHAGFAMLTFAGEARVLARAGCDPKVSESILRQVLEAIEALDGPALQALVLKPGAPYKVAQPGFFVRDFVSDTQLTHSNRGANHPLSSYQISSDFIGDQTVNPGSAAPSLDQYTSLFMGWWAVAHWSTDRTNVRLAQLQADRAINYLLRERFMMDFPGSKTMTGRGGADVRAAAGFFCKMAGETTGRGLDYYLTAKIRFPGNDNTCKACSGSGFVPSLNVQCVACHGSGHMKLVLGSGKCLACNGKGKMKLVIGGQCPACRGSGKMKLVWTDWLGHDHTAFSSNCAMCGGSGHFGTTTQLGTCKFCHGSGHLAQVVRDLGPCKICGGSGRWKATLPKIKCPVCWGTGEWDLYVRDTHPILLALEPLGLLAMSVPHFQVQGTTIEEFLQGTMPKITVGRPTSEHVSAYVRHLSLVCLAHELEIDPPNLLIAAESSNHPWSMALRAAKIGSVLPTLLGKPLVATVMGPATPQLVRLHHECPDQGPSDNSPAWDWVEDNRWERCTDLLQTPHVRSTKGNHYNGLDFLSLEVLMRLNDLGKLLAE